MFVTTEVAIELKPTTTLNVQVGEVSSKFRDVYVVEFDPNNSLPLQGDRSVLHLSVVRLGSKATMRSQGHYAKWIYSVSCTNKEIERVVLLAVHHPIL